MASVAITSDQDLVVAEIFIEAPPDRIFHAITQPQQLTQWWGQSGMYRTLTAEADLRPGGLWRTSGQGADGSAFEVRGEYREIDPPRLLVYTWHPSWDPSRSTLVRWELSAQEKGTLVRVRHSGFAGDRKAAEDHSNGWTRVLGWLQAFSEQGETIDSRPPFQPS